VRFLDKAEPLSGPWLTLALGWKSTWGINSKTYLALAWRDPHLEVLSPSARQRLEDLRSEIRARWAVEEGRHRVLVERIAGCLDKLEASLLQVLRLRKYHDHVLNTAASISAPYAAFRGDEACADFESLLLHGRAALDRLTWLVSGEFRQQSSSYRTLANMLRNFSNDRRAQRLGPVLAEARPWLDGLYAKLDSDLSLRDIVGHREAISEGMECCFGVFRLSSDKVLLADCEVRFTPDMPSVAVFGTAVESARFLPFVILNGAAVFLEREGIALNDCASPWQSSAVAVTRYLVDEAAGSPLGQSVIQYAARMLPSGFRASTRNVKPEIMTHAIALGLTAG
jgi:hypothetical protein